jgi:hypothetical protein
MIGSARRLLMGRKRMPPLLSLVMVAALFWTGLSVCGVGAEDLSLRLFKKKWGSQRMYLYAHAKGYHPFRYKIWEWGKRLGGSRLENRLVKLIRE